MNRTETDAISLVISFMYEFNKYDNINDAGRDQPMLKSNVAHDSHDIKALETYATSASCLQLFSPPRDRDSTHLSLS